MIMIFLIIYYIMYQKKTVNNEVRPCKKCNKPISFIKYRVLCIDCYRNNKVDTKKYNFIEDSDE